MRAQRVGAAAIGRQSGPEARGIDQLEFRRGLPAAAARRDGPGDLHRRSLAHQAEGRRGAARLSECAQPRLSAARAGQQQPGGRPARAYGRRHRAGRGDRAGTGGRAALRHRAVPESAADPGGRHRLQPGLSRHHQFLRQLRPQRQRRAVDQISDRCACRGAGGDRRSGGRHDQRGRAGVGRRRRRQSRRPAALADFGQSDLGLRPGADRRLHPVHFRRLSE